MSVGRLYSASPRSWLSSATSLRQRVDSCLAKPVSSNTGEASRTPTTLTISLSRAKRSGWRLSWDASWMMAIMWVGFITALTPVPRRRTFGCMAVRAARAVSKVGSSDWSASSSPHQMRKVHLLRMQWFVYVIGMPERSTRIRQRAVGGETTHLDWHLQIGAIGRGIAHAPTLGLCASAPASRLITGAEECYTKRVYVRAHTHLVRARDSIHASPSHPPSHGLPR